MMCVPMFKVTNPKDEVLEAENKYLRRFMSIPIDKGFYFSYTYDLTRSLQENIMRKIRKKEQRDKEFEYSNILDTFHKEVDYADIYAHDFFLGKDPGSI